MKKYLPLAATAVIFVASLIILATPLRPQITSVTPELKNNQSWETYKNDKYGFEFKYPNDLNLTTGDNQITLSNSHGDGGVLNIYPDIKTDIPNFEMLQYQQCQQSEDVIGEGCPKLLVNTKGQLLPEVKQKTLNNIGQIYYRLSSPAVIDFDFYWWKVDQNIFKLSIPSYWSNSEQILSTFKFTQ